MRLNQLLLPLAGLLLIVPSCEGRVKRHVPRSKVKHSVVRPALAEGPVQELRARNLILPVAETNPETWKHSFYSVRGGGKLHHAVDMRAPIGTPVRAVDNGTIARMNTGKRGGISIYHVDSQKKFNYYYCHLHRYARDLRVGSRVTRGQVIGYVGSTGHSSGPHLHFQISKIVNPVKLWAGQPLNPYSIFANSAQSRSCVSLASRIQPKPPVLAARSRQRKINPWRNGSDRNHQIASLRQKNGSGKTFRKHIVATARSVRSSRRGSTRLALAAAQYQTGMHRVRPPLTWKNARKSAKKDNVIAISRKQKTLLARKRTSRLVARAHVPNHFPTRSRRTKARFGNAVRIASTHYPGRSRYSKKSARSRSASYRSASLKRCKKIALTARPTGSQS